MGSTAASISCFVCMLMRVTFVCEVSDSIELKVLNRFIFGKNERVVLFSVNFNDRLQDCFTLSFIG